MSRTQAEYLWLILLATAVGVLAAFGNFLLREAIRLFMWVFQVVEWNALQIPRGMPFSLLIPIVLVSGGVVVALLEWLLPGDIMGYGFPAFLEKIHLGDARLKARWIFAKAVGPAVSLGAGASVGREGPIAQIGGAIGSVVARLARLSTERSKVLVACGAGAGIATTFNAPIGGLLFAQEIVLLGQTELGNLSLLVISASVGVVVSRATLGNLAVLPVQQIRNEKLLGDPELRHLGFVDRGRRARFMSGSSTRPRISSTACRCRAGRGFSSGCSRSESSQSLCAAIFPTVIRLSTRRSTAGSPRR